METRQLLEKLDKCSQQQQTEIMQWKSQITVVLIPSACTPIVTVSLEDLDALGDVTVYPNPVDNIVNVELGSLESASVRLLDVNGKVLFLNIYADPSQVHDWPEFFEAIARLRQFNVDSFFDAKSAFIV